MKSNSKTIESARRPFTKAGPFLSRSALLLPAVVVSACLWLEPARCQAGPAIYVTKQCPANAPAPGQTLYYTGMVFNAGSAVLSNIFVVNNHPANNTVVLFLPILPVGAAYPFSGSYPAPTNACSVTDTLLASANAGTVANGVQTTCPIATTPAITVTETCAINPVSLGETLVFSGAVSNAGNVTLTNVVVVSNQPTNNTPVLGPITLTVGATTNYSAAFTPSDCGPSIASTVTGRGASVCSGGMVTSSVTTACEVTCPSPAPLMLNPAHAGNTFVFSFQTQSNRLYTVQVTPSLAPTDWRVLTNFVADGSPAVIHDTMTDTQRFYRLFLQ
jgi:uncharacterized repeat protein (TIGR01451 family)